MKKIGFELLFVSIKYIFVEHYGGLAHLARALAWQARGGRFESDILHKKAVLFKTRRLFLFCLEHFDCAQCDKCFSLFTF